VGEASDDSGKVAVSCATWGFELGLSDPRCTLPPGKEAPDTTKLKDSLAHLASTTVLTPCKDAPVYIVKGSRVKSQDTTDKASSLTSKSKKATGYPGETLVDPASLFKVFDSCSTALQAASNKADADDSSLTTKIGGINAQLTNLLAAQEKQKEAQNLVLAQTYDNDIRLLSNKIKELQTKSHEPQLAKTIIASLLAQVGGLRADVAGQVNQAAPPEAPPEKSTFQSVWQNMVNNLLTFLAASLVLGLALDPVQRVVMSWIPLRARRFRALNARYSRSNPQGEIRFGDRRYERGDRLQREDPDIYQPNYAIGRGLLTQSEYNALSDEYYRQSQLATGLIFPLLMLAVAGYTRIFCCFAFGFWTRIGWICLGVVLWGIAAFLLWGVGVDRLHQFYSEVQSRIAGRAKKLATTEEEKVLALLMDPKSREHITQEFEKRSAEHERLRKILDAISKVDPPAEEEGGDQP
jgi:hypothetical protein